MKKRTKLKILLPIYAAVLVVCLCTAHFGNQAVTVMVERAPIKQRSCVVIDAGHGGIDGGATSCSGILESELNLQIAHRLNDLLKFMGYDTRMIRTTDTSIYTEGTTIAAQKVSDLKERVRTVNETDNALLVSIHQNAFPDSRYSGAQVFYANDSKSQTFAQAMQKTFIDTINRGSNRKCKPSDGIYLMQHIQTTGILIECGFLSNPTEEAKLRSENYQKNIACVIASCCSTYLEKE